MIHQITNCHFQNCWFLIVLSLCIVGALATFDLSNVDLINFEYFKYPPTSTAKPYYFIRNGITYSIRKLPPSTSKFEDSLNRAKAVAKYLRNLALGNPDEKIKSKHVLDPEFGKKWSQHFQSKHGAFGEKLVTLLGSGISREELEDIKR